MDTTQFRLSQIEKRLDRLLSYDGSPVIGDTIGILAATQYLRGYWLGSKDENGAIYDQSGQGRTLTNTAGVDNPATTGGMSYYLFNGTTQYLTRASEAGTAITGTLTFGMWMNFTTVASVTFAGRYGAAANHSYAMQTSGSAFQGVISNTGTADIVINSGFIPAARQWCFVVLRFTPSTELALFVNGVKYANTTAIPASIFAGTAALQFGASSANSQFLAGRIGMPFLSSFNLPDGYLSRLYDVSRTLFSV